MRFLLVPSVQPSIPSRRREKSLPLQRSSICVRWNPLIMGLCATKHPARACARSDTHTHAKQQNNDCRAATALSGRSESQRLDSGCKQIPQFVDQDTWRCAPRMLHLRKRTRIDSCGARIEIVRADGGGGVRWWLVLVLEEAKPKNSCARTSITTFSPFSWPMFGSDSRLQMASALVYPRYRMRMSLQCCCPSSHGARVFGTAAPLVLTLLSDATFPLGVLRRSRCLQQFAG